MNKKGQSVFSEYVMIFFVAIACLIAMTAFVRRSIQARIHDANNFMINAVANSQVCDANCLMATGGKISPEYEPYYQQVVSDVQQNIQEKKGETTGNPAALGAVYLKSVSGGTQAITNSNQLPPECADGATSAIVNCDALRAGSGQ